ncbi:MAG: DUF1080 domain-containing protein [Verrucomicrobiota bacterium]
MSPLNSLILFVSSLAITCLTSAETSRALFNGKDLSGWTIINNGQFSVEGGLLKVTRGTGWLRSTETYADFRLILEFRFMEPGSNSGIFVRTGPTSHEDENGWPDNGIQVQALDKVEGQVPLAFIIPYGAPPFEHVSNLESLKSVYKPAGKWHRYEIECVGEVIKVYLNGTLITLAVEVKNAEGHVGIQGEHGLLEFRKIEIEEL